MPPQVFPSSPAGDKLHEFPDRRNDSLLALAYSFGHGTSGFKSTASCVHEPLKAIGISLAPVTVSFSEETFLG